QAVQPPVPHRSLALRGDWLRPVHRRQPGGDPLPAREAGGAAAVTLLLLLLAAAGAAQAKENPNEKFLKPDLDVPGWVKKFESPGREVYDKRKQIAAAAHLRPGAAVADVGAGTGLFTMLFAEAVGPKGTVYAVEIAPRFLDYLEKRARKAGARN